MDFIKKNSQSNRIDLNNKRVSQFNNKPHSNTNNQVNQKFSSSPKTPNQRGFSMNPRINSLNKNKLSGSQNLNGIYQFKKKPSDNFSEHVFKLKNTRPFENRSFSNSQQGKVETKVESKKVDHETKKENNFSESRKNTFLDQIIASSLYFLIIGLPLFFLNLTYQGINFEKQFYFYFWAFVGLSAWGIKVVSERQFIFKKTPLDFALIAFLATLILSTLFSVDRYHSLVGIFKYPVIGLISAIFLSLFFYLVIINIRYLSVKKSLFFIAGVGVLISFWTSFVFITIGFDFFSKEFLAKIPLNFLGTSFFSLATYLFFLIPIVITSIEFAKKLKIEQGFKKVINIILYATLISILFNILVLFNYVYWVTSLIALGVFVIFVLGKVVEISQKNTYTLVGIFLALIIIFVVKIPIFNDNFLKKELVSDYKTSWEVAQNSVKENPILGSGLGTFSYNFSLFRPRPKNLEDWNNDRILTGKNLFFETVSTIGIFGLVSLMAVILLYIGYFFHSLNYSSDKDKLLSLCLFSSNLILIFSTFAGFVDGSILILSVVLTALSIVTIRKESNVKVKEKKISLQISSQYALLQSFLLLVISIAIIFSLISLTKIFLADIYIKKAQSFYLENNNEKASDYFSKVLNKNKNEGNYYNDLSLYCYDFFNHNDEEMIKNQPNICIDNLNQFSLISAKLMPNDFIINKTTGFIIYKTGWKYVADSINESRKFYKKALELEPKNPFLEITLAEIDITEAQFIEEEENLETKNKLLENAKSLLKKAQNKLESPEQMISIYEKLSAVNMSLGNTDESIKNLEEAVEKMDVILLKNSSNGDILSKQLSYKFNLATLLMQKGMNGDDKKNSEDIKKSEFLLKQILRVDKKNVNVLLSLALLYKETDRLNEAIDMYNNALKALPENSENREKVEKLIDNLTSGNKSD